MGNGEMSGNPDPSAARERADAAVSLINRFNAAGRLGDGVRLEKITGIHVSEGIDVLAGILGADLLGCAIDDIKSNLRFYYYFYYGDVTFWQFSEKELGKDTVHFRKWELEV